MKRIILLSALVVGAAASASADVTRDLGFGWEVTIIDPTRSDVVADPGSSLSSLLLEKTAEFTSLAPIVLQFRQILPDDQTASSIVITDEIINNNSSVDWSNFQMLLAGPGLATFDPGASASFSISPFTTATFQLGNTSLLLSGGVLTNGSLWTPGLESGELVIHVDLSAVGPAAFELWETPNIPSPGFVAVAALAGVMTARRCR